MSAASLLRSLEHGVLETGACVSYRSFAQQHGVRASVAKLALAAFAAKHAKHVSPTFQVSVRVPGEPLAVRVVSQAALDVLQGKHADSILSVHVYSVQKSLPADGALLWTSACQKELSAPATLAVHATSAMRASVTAAGTNDGVGADAAAAAPAPVSKSDSVTSVDLLFEAEAKDRAKREEDKRKRLFGSSSGGKDAFDQFEAKSAGRSKRKSSSSAAGTSTFFANAKIKSENKRGGDGDDDDDNDADNDNRQGPDDADGKPAPKRRRLVRRRVSMVSSSSEGDDSSDGGDDDGDDALRQRQEDDEAERRAAAASIAPVAPVGGTTSNSKAVGCIDRDSDSNGDDGAGDGDDEDDEAPAAGVEEQENTTPVRAVGTIEQAFAKTATGGVGKSNKRRKVRQVVKTFQDEEGFDVTETVDEVYYETASDVDTPPPSATAAGRRTQTSPAKRAAASDEAEASPAKKKSRGAGKKESDGKKQPSIMSFFKRS